MNYKIIIHTLGWVLICEAVCLLLPLACAILYAEPQIDSFLICITVMLILGVVMTVKTPRDKSMYAKEGYIIVALSWIFMSIFGAIPFVISGSIPHFTDALFETVSGFTTTGASILTNVEAMPKSLLFWRSFTHWIGGMGVIVFLVALLPLSGGNNLFLIKAESPGPSVNKIVPKVKSMAKILYGIYILYTMVEVILLLCGGMTLFEALTLSFGTAGTGGFAVLNSSFASYSSYVQIVVTIFMIVFGVDFSLYYLCFKGRFKDAWKSSELKVYLGIILASVVVIALNCNFMFPNLFDSFKHSAFQVASIITTTGFATTDFNLWPSLPKTILVVLMFVGACAGSTGGGIKVSRVIILMKSIVKEVRIAAHPKRTYKISMNSRIVNHETLRAINVFFVSYMAIFVLSLLIISINNFDFTTNFTAVAATINNIGPGLGLVGPTGNFSMYSPLSKIILIFDMLIGRLEVFPILILFSSNTWKK